MSGCLDNVRCYCPEWTCCEFLRDVEWSEHRNRFASIFSGIFFFVGWWIIFDAAVYPGWSLPGRFHAVGVVSTLAFFLINAISTGQLSGDNYTDGFIGQRGARVWMFIGFLMAFAGLIAAAWILFGVYVVPPSHSHCSSPTHQTITNHTITNNTNLTTTTPGTYSSTSTPSHCIDNDAVWPGVAVMLQNLFIFIGSLIFKFGRSEDLWE